MADLDISENLINILLLILCFVFLVLLYCKYLTKRENMDGDQDLMSSLLNKSFTLYSIIDGNKYYLGSIPVPKDFKSKNECLNNLVVLIKETEQFKTSIDEYTNTLNKENDECKKIIETNCKPPDCTPDFGECLRTRNYSSDFNVRKIENTYRILSTPGSIVKDDGKYNTNGTKFVMMNKDSKVCLDAKISSEGAGMNIDLVKSGQDILVKINDKYISACNDILITEYNAYEVCLSEDINKAIKFILTNN